MWAGPLLSGLVHVALIALAIETLPWLRAGKDHPVPVVSVTIVTPSDLAALTRPAPPAPEPPVASPAPAPIAVPAAPPTVAAPAVQPPAEDPDPLEETLAPGFDPAAPLGMAAAEDPATAALALTLDPEPLVASAPPALAAPAAPPRPGARGDAPLLPASPPVASAPRIVPLPPPSRRVLPPTPSTRVAEPPPVRATDAPATVPLPSAGSESAPDPAPDRVLDTVLGPVFVDPSASATPTLRPNLPSPGSGVSTYVPPLVLPRGIPGDSPALRRPPSGTEEAATAAFETAVRESVTTARVYPTEAMTRGVEGAAGLKVIVRRDGRLVTAILVRSSGSSTLDRAALDAARRATLPAAPHTLPGDRFSVDVTLAFTLAPETPAEPPAEAPASLPVDGG